MEKPSSKEKKSYNLQGIIIILSIVGLFSYFLWNTLAILFLLWSVFWWVKEKLKKSSNRNTAAPRVLSIGSFLLCIIVYVLTWMFSASDCDCYDVFRQAMLRQDYSYSTYNECIDRFKEEVIDGYKELDCSPEQRKSYLAGSNWTLYFMDKCQGTFGNGKPSNSDEASKKMNETENTDNTENTDSTENLNENWKVTNEFFVRYDDKDSSYISFAGEVLYWDFENASEGLNYMTVDFGNSDFPDIILYFSSKLNDSLKVNCNIDLSRDDFFDISRRNEFFTNSINDSLSIEGQMNKNWVDLDTEMGNAPLGLYVIGEAVKSRCLLNNQEITGSDETTCFRPSRLRVYFQLP